MEVLISQTFAVAIAHHQSGRLAEAEGLYRQILVIDPNNVSVLSNLGLIVSPDEALALFQKATALDPNHADAQINLGGALEALGRLDEAAASYERVVALRPDNPVGFFRLGVIQHRQGNLGHAVACYERVIALQPNHADALNNLSLALKASSQINETFALAVSRHQAGSLSEAEELYRRILAVNPENISVLNNLGLIVSREEAEELFRRAVTIRPDYFDAQINLATTLEALDRLDEADIWYQRALGLDPQSATVLSRLGTLRQKQNRFEEAEAFYQRTLAIKPDFTEALNNLGIALKALGRSEEAVTYLRRAIALKPDYSEAYLNLGNAFRDINKLEDAIESYQQALKVRPDDPLALFSLGVMLQSQGRLYDAASRYERAIVTKPDFTEALNNLGLALKEMGHMGDAIARLTQSLAIKPDYLDALLNLGNSLKDLGRYEEALARYDEGLRIRPDFIGALHNRLFTLACMDTLSAEAVAAEHIRYGEGLMARTPGAPAPFANSREADRRLRIGYVSPDFRRHSVSYFLEPLLAAHDHAGFEIFCYAEVGLPDEATTRFQRYADHWLITVNRSDEELAARIRADGIDILVDVAGHTAGNRLPLFARRPAPLQVTWLGYPNTTGIPTIDYRLVDDVSDPPGWSDALASETLIRLPGGFLCFAPPAESPPTGMPPCLATNTVTFGSFNNPGKISRSTLDTWAAILNRLPDARMLLKGRQLVDSMACDTLRTGFAERGIAPERLDMQGFLLDTGSHLKIYDRVDIGLDPFPYNGTTTTCEALWMGVPVVTLAGDRHAGRVGASLLTRVGLEELIVANQDEYVERAVELAGDRERLVALRAALRPRMAGSTLCDAAAFARSVEAAYREMWRRWIS